MSPSPFIPLGIFHTLIAFVAVFAGIAALVRDKEIRPASGLGKTYITATIVTCLTAFGIFQHGGFGPPHALAILTLAALVLAAIAARSRVFGGTAPYVVAVSLSATFLFHLVPAVTEGTTRLPPGAPVFASQDEPALKALTGILFVVFIVGAILQVRYLRRRDALRASSPVLRPQAMRAGGA